MLTVMKKYLTFFSLIILFSTILCACNSTNSISFKNIYLDGYGIGESIEFTYNDFLGNKEFKMNELSFSSSNSNIAKVKNNIVSCLNAGEVEISLYYKNAYQDKLTLKVQNSPQNLQYVSVVNSNIKLEKNEEIDISKIVSITPINLKNEVIVNSTNEDIVYFQNYKLIANNLGEASISILIPKAIGSNQYVERKINIEVKDDLYIKDFEFTNLIDEKLLFSINERGKLEYNAVIPSGTRVIFYASNDLIDIDKDGNFSVQNMAGKGTITAKFKNAFESYFEQNIEFEILGNKELNSQILLDNVTLKDYEYEAVIQTDIDFENFIFGDNVQVVSCKKLADKLSINFKFLETGLQNFSLTYKVKYSFHTDTISISNFQTFVYDLNKFEYKFKCNDFEVSNLKCLYLTRNNFSAEEYFNLANIVVYYDGQLFNDFSISNLNEDFLELENNEVRPIKEGQGKLKLMLGKFEEEIELVVQKLQATKIIYECEKGLYLNTKNDRTILKCSLDLPNAIGNEIQISNLTPNIISIENDIIIAKSKGVGKILLENNSIKEEIEIVVDYGITDYNILLNGSTIHNDEITLNKGENYYLTCELKSGDIVLNSEFEIAPKELSKSFYFEGFNFTTYLVFMPLNKGNFKIKIIEASKNFEHELNVIVI